MCKQPRLAHLRFAIVGVCLVFFWGYASTTGYADDSWTPGPANDPKNCHELWEKIGLPRYRPSVEVDTTLVCHGHYVLSYNNNNKTPDWVREA
jgi:hypothetical protein